MHDNVCVTLLPAYVHSCQPSLQVMSSASLTRGETGREREKKKKEPSQTQSNMYPNNPSHRNRAPKNGQQRPAFINLSTPLHLCKKKKRGQKKSLASATDSIPTGKTQVPCLLDYMFEHMLGAARSNLNYNRVAMNIIVFGELEL